MSTPLDPHAGVIFRLAWRDAWRQLTDTEVGTLTRALLAHAAGEEVDADALPGRLLPGMYAVHAVQIDMDIAQYADKIQRRREAGRKGGRPRKVEVLPEAEAEEAPEAEAEATPEPEEKPAPVPAKKEPEAVPAERLDAAGVYMRDTLHYGADRRSQFETFWKAYPKKAGKVAACKAYWGLLRKGMATPEGLLAGAQRYREAKAGSPYLQDCVNWLNAGKYEDEPAPASSGIARLSGIAAAAARLDAEEAGHD